MISKGASWAGPRLLFIKFSEKEKLANCEFIWPKCLVWFVLIKFNGIRTYLFWYEFKLKSNQIA